MKFWENISNQKVKKTLHERLISGKILVKWDKRLKEDNGFLYCGKYKVGWIKDGKVLAMNINYRMTDVTRIELGTLLFIEIKRFKDNCKID